MNKAVIIGIGVAVPIVIFVILIGLDVNSAQQLKFSAVENEDFETLIGELEVKKDKGVLGVIMDFYRVTEKPIELYSQLLKIF